MKKFIRSLTAASIGLALAAPAMAASLDDMVGTWGWEDYTVEVTHCDATTVCAEVVSGPQNVGMQMLETAPVADGEAYKAKVKHPATGETYFAKMSFDGDIWSMDGCTEAGVCAEGEFHRK